MRKGGGGGPVPSHVPFLRVLPLHAPFRVNGAAWTGERAAAACSRAPPPLPRKCGGADGGEGRAREAEGRRALCAPYLHAKGVVAVNVGKGKNRVCKDLSSLPSPSHPRPFASKRGHIMHRSVRAQTRKGGAHGTRRHFPLGRPALFTRKGGHKGTLSPAPSLPHSRGRAHEGAPPLSVAFGLPFPLAALPCTRGKGTREGTGPPPPPFLIHAEGGHNEGTPPRLFAPPRSCRKGARDPRPLPPPLDAPPCTRRERIGHATPWFPPSPFAWKGCMRGCRPWHPFPFPLGHAAPCVREGRTPGHAIPTTLPHSRGWGGARRHTASFAQEGVHEAKPCPPPHVSRSRAGAVSVRLCSLRPHPVFACHSTT
ncbi:hypothetical protein EDB83DRAFT_2320293 [Lactarius deliciosus]|nr:hypothetical protein EDB83DRAFT_2320293 [Lactarius deliciosus]